MQINANIIVSVCSVIVAIAALFVAVWQVYTTQKHNRLSVIPHLTIVSTSSHRAPRFVAELQNTGVGPAIINRFAVFLDQEEQTGFDASCWTAIFDLLGLKGICGGVAVDPGTFLAPGQKIRLILYDDGLEKEQVIRDALRRIKIMIEYQSIYGKSMSPCIFEVGISLMDCFEHD